jgi:outer membrane protein, heavy metal efflux system
VRIGHAIKGMVLAVVSVLTLAAPATASGWMQPELQGLVREAMEHNRDLAAQRELAESLAAKVSFAGSLDDPRLGISLLNVPVDSFEFDQEAMTQKQLSLAQRIPWAGTLSLKERGAALDALKQEGMVAAREWALAKDVARAWYDLGFVGQSLEVNTRLSGLVTRMLQVAESRYATGAGLQQDILLAQVELTRLLDEKLTLERKRRTLADRLNELLSRDRFLDVPFSNEPSLPELVLDVAALREQALKDNPLLGVRKTEAERAGVAEELARKAYYPGMDFKVAYGQREDDPRTGRDRADFASAGVTFSIPLWASRRQDSQLEAAQKALAAARKTVAGLETALPHQVDALVAEIKQLRESYSLVRDALLVQAGQWSASSLAAYETGKIEFGPMIGAQMRVLRYELQASRYLYDVHAKLAALEELVGSPLEDAPLAGAPSFESEKHGEEIAHAESAGDHR